MNDRTKYIIRAALHIAYDRDLISIDSDHQREEVCSPLFNQANTSDSLCEVRSQVNPRRSSQYVPRRTNRKLNFTCNDEDDNDDDSFCVYEPLELQDVSEDEYKPGSNSGSPSTSSDDEGSTGAARIVHEEVCSEHVQVEEETVANSEESPEKRGKKRKRRSAEWAKRKAKLLRNSGESYKSRTGNVVKAREMGPLCSNKCKLKCGTKFTEEQRRAIFTEYWNLKCLQRQRAFVAKSTRPKQVKYRRVTDGTPRAPNHSFHLSLKPGEETTVCKTFFVNTLGITDRTLRTVQKKTSPNGFVATEGRGKHMKHKKIPDEVVQSVYSHINSIPRI